MQQFTVAVGFSPGRPVRPNQRTHVVTFMFDGSDIDAVCFAAQWVASRPGVAMVTSAEILSVVL
ncbi:MAG: hypothetical protein NVS3B1_17700 [Marmoricola sp.]